MSLNIQAVLWYVHGRVQSPTLVYGSLLELLEFLRDDFIQSCSVNVYGLHFILELEQEVQVPKTIGFLELELHCRGSGSKQLEVFQN